MRDVRDVRDMRDMRDTGTSGSRSGSSRVTTKDTNMNHAANYVIQWKTTVSFVIQGGNHHAEK